jgi:hypothetical protein
MSIGMSLFSLLHHTHSFVTILMMKNSMYLLYMEKMLKAINLPNISG